MDWKITTKVHECPCSFKGKFIEIAIRDENKERIEILFCPNCLTLKFEGFIEHELGEKMKELIENGTTRFAPPKI